MSLETYIYYQKTIKINILEFTLGWNYRKTWGWWVGPASFDALRSDQAQAAMETRGLILSPWLGDEAGYGVGLSYRPASLCSLVGRYDNPWP